MFGTASSSDEPPGEPAGARSDRGIRQPVFSGGDPQATGADVERPRDHAGWSAVTGSPALDFDL
jgi:hypothetical protein